jgi:hypothetical protein
MKKPAGVTKEQWAKYKRNLDLALGVMNKSLDLVADINFEAGEIVERDRIIKIAENRICFDHKKGCDHAACYALSDLIVNLKGEQK